MLARFSDFFLVLALAASAVTLCFFEELFFSCARRAAGFAAVLFEALFVAEAVDFLVELLRAGFLVALLRVDFLVALLRVDFLVAAFFARAFTAPFFADFFVDLRVGFFPALLRVDFFAARGGVLFLALAFFVERFFVDFFFAAVERAETFLFDLARALFLVDFLVPILFLLLPKLLICGLTKCASKLLALLCQ